MIDIRRTDGRLRYSYPPDDLAPAAARFFAHHHAEIAAAVRDAARWRYLVAENNKGPRGKLRICWADPDRDGLLTTDGVSIDGKDEQAIVRVVDTAMRAGGG